MSNISHNELLLLVNNNIELPKLDNYEIITLPGSNADDDTFERKARAFSNNYGILVLIDFFNLGKNSGWKLPVPNLSNGTIFKVRKLDFLKNQLLLLLLFFLSRCVLPFFNVSIINMPICQY